MKNKTMCTNESSCEPSSKLNLSTSVAPSSTSTEPTQSSLSTPCSQSTSINTSSSSPSTSPVMLVNRMATSTPTGGLVNTGLAMNHFEQYRLQLYNYAMAERLRCSQYQNQLPFNNPYAVGPYGPRLALQMSLFHHRMFAPEEPKPQHSYIGLIAMAILSTPDQKLVLSDIYQHILDNYPYFRNRGPGWRNSIRHNLSLNDCFIKSGRSANGKGHFWAIHPANIDDFKKGDFRRRKAQRKVRKHMGLSVDDDGTDSPSPPPLSLTPPPGLGFVHPWATHAPAMAMYQHVASRKRQFDVASLLAPDESDLLKQPLAKRFHAAVSSDLDEDIDVVASDNDDIKSDEQSTPLDRTPDSLRHDQVATGSPNSNPDDNLSSPPTTAWHGLMQHYPFPSLGIDPRIFGRYYGGYFANRRFGQPNNLMGNHQVEHEPPSVQSNEG